MPYFSLYLPTKTVIRFLESTRRYESENPPLLITRNPLIACCVGLNRTPPLRLLLPAPPQTTAPRKHKQSLSCGRLNTNRYLMQPPYSLVTRVLRRSGVRICFFGPIDNSRCPRISDLLLTDKIQLAIGIDAVSQSFSTFNDAGRTAMTTSFGNRRAFHRTIVSSWINQHNFAWVSQIATYPPYSLCTAQNNHLWKEIDEDSMQNGYVFLGELRTHLGFSNQWWACLPQIGQSIIME